MALEPSLTKNHRKDGLLQKRMSEFMSSTRQPTQVSGDGSCARTDSGVYFGQKATLSTSGRKVPVVVESFGKTNRHWNVPVSMPAFSDLTPNSSDPSPLRLLTTSAIPSKSCDHEVETDLARVHPNSNTNGRMHQKLFTLPNGDTSSGIRNHSPKLPSVQDQGLMKLGMLHSGKDMFSIDTIGRSRPTVLSSPSGGGDRQLGSYSPYTCMSTSPPTYIPLRSDRLTSSTPLTPSPTSPHSSRTFFISYFDLVDTEVKFLDQNHSSRGIVKKVSSNKIATVLNYSGTEVKVPCSGLKLVSPAPKDKVKVVCSNTGTSKILGKIGTLLSLTGDSGVVDFLPFNGDVSRNLAQVKLSYLAKYLKLKTKSHATLPATTCATSTNSIWGSIVLNGGSYPFAPYPTLTSASFPGVLPIVGSSNLSLYNPLALSSAMSTPSGSSITSSFKPFTPSTNDSTRKHNSNLGLPFSFQIPPLNSSGKNYSFGNSSLQPISRGGTCSSDSDGKMRRHSSNGRQDVAETIDRLLSSQRRYHANKEDDSNTDVKASCIRVSLVCPISQKRLIYPSRGSHCKHLQCFDAEAYILMNIHHKLKARVKQANGRSIIQPLPNKKWHCPICLKHVPESQLYIDKSLMSVVTEMGDSMMEVELSEDGSWQPYKKVVVDVIDLTADD